MGDKPPPGDNRRALTWDGFLAILFVAWINFLCYAGVLSDILTRALGLPTTLAAGIAAAAALAVLSGVLVFALAIRSAKKRPRDRAKFAEERAGSTDSEAEQEVRCKRCGATNPADQEQCITCGTAMDIPRFQVRRRSRGSSTVIYVNDYRFKYVLAALFVIAIVIGILMSL
jgi:hypothetical protein